MKISQHKLYTIVFNESNVPTLRIAMRYMGIPNWYKLRKPQMVHILVSNVCANIIIRLFRVEKSVEESWCPISLIPVSELNDLFVHDGISFSRHSLIEYIKSSYDFSNPITRREITWEDVAGLDSPIVNNIFGDREKLRLNLVRDIQEFSAMEDEFEECLCTLIRIKLLGYNDLSDLVVAQIQFHNIWSRIKTIDINRTICVIRSFMDKVNALPSDKRRRIGMRILKPYYSASCVCQENMNICV